MRTAPEKILVIEIASCLSKHNSDEMDKLKRLLALALPVFNAGREPDFRALAKEAGVDEETARKLLKHCIDRINMLNKKVVIIGSLTEQAVRNWFHFLRLIVC